MADKSEIRKLSGSSAWTNSAAKLIFVVIVLMAGFASSSGQRVIDDDLAPPPLKLLSQDEKTKLAGEVEVKKRTKLGLQLMDARLKLAETSYAAENYDEMFVHLGGFHGLMDNMLEFLNNSDKDSGKVLSNFKRFEIGIRAFTPRLQMIHYAVPTRYEQYVRNLLRNLRLARAKAIEPLFDDTVVPDKKPG